MQKGGKAIFGCLCAQVCWLVAWYHMGFARSKNASSSSGGNVKGFFTRLWTGVDGRQERASVLGGVAACAEQSCLGNQAGGVGSLAAPRRMERGGEGAEPARRLTGLMERFHFADVVQREDA
jgi:hypothetical protein